MIPKIPNKRKVSKLHILSGECIRCFSEYEVIIFAAEVYYNPELTWRWRWPRLRRSAGSKWASTLTSKGVTVRDSIYYVNPYFSSFKINLGKLLSFLKFFQNGGWGFYPFVFAMTCYMVHPFRWSSFISLCTEKFYANGHFKYSYI